jgi:membrane protein
MVRPLPARKDPRRNNNLLTNLGGHGPLFYVHIYLNRSFMSIPKRLKILTLLRKALEEFRKNDPLRMAGATAFFTTFALPAVLIILIQVFGLVLSPRFLSRQLFHSLGDLLGKNTAEELHQTLYHVRHLINNWFEASLGFLFLIFVATTLLKVIKDSLNQLWSIRVVKKQGIQFRLVNRAKSFVVILIAGILFLILLLAEGGLDLIQKNSNGSTLVQGLLAKALFRQLISFILATVWFSLLFKFLPDGHTGWKTVITGATFTGILFALGKLLLQWLLNYSSMQTIYGASAASVLLLLFVFYSSFIFYYGACFTIVWSEFKHKPIQPAKYAEKYKWSRVPVTS